MSAEYHQIPATYGRNSRPARQGIRIPVEMHWASDWFRAWLYVDLWNEIRRKHMMTEHTLTVGLALLDSFTLFERTFSLAPIYRLLGLGGFTPRRTPSTQHHMAALQRTDPTGDSMLMS